MNNKQFINKAYRLLDTDRAKTLFYTDMVMSPKAVLRDLNEDTDHDVDHVGSVPGSGYTEFADPQQWYRYPPLEVYRSDDGSKAYVLQRSAVHNGRESKWPWTSVEVIRMSED